ncbi:MAG: Fic family protein [Firmicutes bacterium]|nr:Fic family protein [Bacillota bacterium]MCM1400979.1 Fic family protein [Bacteroides sp.]MCM1476502.1 Fic family protein [Bacteroides sp.]
MNYISVKEWAGMHGVSERTARNYCAQGKIEGAYLVGKNWNIPADAEIPKRSKKQLNASALLTALREQMSGKIKGGIYHRIQVDLTYNSNHMEGSRLTHDQTRYIFETNTVGVTGATVNVDDIIETANHFRAIDHIISSTSVVLSESYIKHLHFLLKSGTSVERKDWFRIGDYKKLPNEAGGNETVAPEDVHKAMKELLREYNSKKMPTFEDVIDFHQRFEAIHPFQDGNGRVGRLIMFRECLRIGYVPFIFTEELKMFYYSGLRNWPSIKGYLMDTCLTAQDNFKQILDKFRIPYKD